MSIYLNLTSRAGELCAGIKKRWMLRLGIAIAKDIIKVYIITIVHAITPSALNGGRRKLLMQHMAFRHTVDILNTRYISVDSLCL